MCERYRTLSLGKKGYAELSRRPHHSPNKTPEYIVDEIVSRRRKRKPVGAKKLVVRLKKQHPQWSIPSVATVNRILDREGLLKKRRRTRQMHPGCPKTVAEAPNDIWGIDYKGQFKLKNGTVCYPLTISDLYSRYLLGCEGHRSANHQQTRNYLEKIFRENGLPCRIRSDNGVPFATNAIARLSQLSVWFILLGIYPELIEPGQPQQNGIHERMHRTLKQEATIPPSSSMRAQQRRFDAFRREFNTEREHEALGQRCPAEIYVASPREFPSRIQTPEYPDHYIVRKVSSAGTARLFKRQFFVATPLRDQYIGFEEVDDRVYDVYFSFYQIGRYDATRQKLEGVISSVPVSYRRMEHA